MTTLFGLDAEDIGAIAQEAVTNFSDIGEVWWNGVGRAILEVLLAERDALREPEAAPDEAEARKQAHIRTMLNHLSKENK